ELTEHKAVSHKASFQFLTETYFLFPHSPLLAFKYNFAYSTRTLLVNDFLRGKL
ncbi:nef attachable domain protein, partial [Chlamydia psittaci 02DC21]